MRVPRFSLRSLLLIVVAIALFLPHYPFCQMNTGGELSAVTWSDFFPEQVEYEHRPGKPPLFVPFPTGIFVKSEVWQTVAAELLAIAGWLLLKRLRARRLTHSNTAR